MDPEAQYQAEQEQAQLETYDGPIDPATEQAIQELTDAGSKAFVFQDYELAVEKFGLASEMLGQVYGEMSPKNADTLFLYGKALLEYAIQQSSVLGGVTEKKSEKELQAVVDAVTGGASGSSSAPNSSRFVFEGDDDDEDEEEEEEENGEGASGAPAEGGEEGAAQDDNDDFAVAWDVLDLARVLYHKVGTEEALLKLGDVHMALGDVSLESENFEQAVADFREALLVKESRLEADDRQLAEAHYKLALALEFSPTEADKASEHITKAIGVLKLRIEKLNGMLGSGKGKARASDANESETQMAKELVELHEFVGEMEQKIQDLATNQANKPLEDPSQVALFSQMLNAQKVQVANDISSLIKPKTNKVTETPASSSSSSPSTTATITTTTSTTTTTTTTITEAESSATEESLKRKAEEVSENKADDEADKKIKI
ncbi:hypothetical protein BG006_009595 [Podila minutissima]|uniref:Tetratricopeptide SHNi-TPR domain-containing protein n=1 Tax=Podila minutissima TaxID=64525 RepID=A0A9P5SEA3_9FUNG|nr:hypothetical protein BG006_009595 [Podila minutissima]